ncbi:hypothetical protein [uncultured Amphritea sp.]|uniref:hypothetical protein n=1 Tax=uncultured Amphritea sp. TaxID=981605 RepID=UPI002629649C|nr:hypothetical protein [uncultured Amphritea sp.]
MNIAQLWITGSQTDVTSVCCRLGLNPDSSWRQGDKRRDGKVEENDGVGICVADVSTPKELVGEIRSFINRCANSDIDFKKLSLKATLSIGYTVGDPIQFAACIDFTDQDLQCLARVGVSLSL